MQRILGAMYKIRSVCLSVHSYPEKRISTPALLGHKYIHLPIATDDYGVDRIGYAKYNMYCRWNY